MIREALLTDIAGMQLVRNAVKENRLSDPALVPDADYVTYLTRRGKGWLAEVDGLIVGFAIADLTGNNVWALFLHPDHERTGIGRRLHDAMLNWYFAQTEATLWLSTAPGTRAEGFYRRAGWMETGTYGNGEIRFEMSKTAWEKRKS